MAQPKSITFSDTDAMFQFYLHYVVIAAMQSPPFALVTNLRNLTCDFLGQKIERRDLALGTDLADLEAEIGKCCTCTICELK